MIPSRQSVAIQNAAKAVLSAVGSVISCDSTEQSIAAFAVERLAQFGYSETWYHSCPALVLLGSRSCLSISGREYAPATELVGETNLITVDLSPCKDSCWGDCARSFVVENGRVVSTPLEPEFQRGNAAVQELHMKVLGWLTPETTFGGLYDLANRLIRSAGLENLDFLDNVGHSIAMDLADREFAEAGNRRALGSVPYFTFEPHVREIGGRWGFKHENIYYFNDAGKLTEL